MRYVSTRGVGAPQRFTDVVLEGLAPDGGLYVPDSHAARRPRRLARARLSGTGLRSPFALCRRHSSRGIQENHFQDLHQLDFRQRRDHAAEDARAGAAHPRPVQRPDARLQGPRAAAARQPVRVRARAARRAAQHPRRHLGRHRLGGRARDARQEEPARVHALAARAHEPVPGGADVQPAGRQHPQPRARGRVRRLPGHRQGGRRRRRIQAPPPHRHRQLDQLGARRGAGGVLLQGLLRRHRVGRRAGLVRRALGQLRQHLRRPRGALDGAADPAPDPGQQRERRAGRVLPQRALPGEEGEGGQGHLEPFDGHLQGLQLRALRLRPGRRRRRAGERAVAPARRRGRVRPLALGLLPQRRRDRVRLRPLGARRPPRHHPRRCGSATARWSTRTPPTASRSGSSGARRACRWCASRPRCRPSSPRRSARPWGANPSGRAGYEDIERLPQRFEALPADAQAVKQYLAAHAA